MHGIQSMCLYLRRIYVCISPTDPAGNWSGSVVFGMEEEMMFFNSLSNIFTSSLPPKSVQVASSHSGMRAGFFIYFSCEFLKHSLWLHLTIANK